MAGNGPVAGIAFDNSYKRLPERFYVQLDPTPVRAPRLLKVNDRLARLVGIDPGWLASAEGIAVLSGNAVPSGAEPIAMAYAGHQFGGFVPQLGDGRAILLGEVVGRDGVRRDIQLKGSGPTPFSRRGDGRAALGPVLREYIVSEAMAALGIPTTRALAAVTTGEYVMRETPLPGAVLTRVAASHVRIGTFQYFAARGDTEGLRLLTDHVINRLYPELSHSEQPYLALIEAVVERQAALVASWLAIGFIHGVMNTDNMSIAGETIDYGPCAFMDAFDPGRVLSSIDQMGRYAYGNQPSIAQWNLARFAETLLVLIDADETAAINAATAVLDRFPALFSAHYLDRLRAKAGLRTAMEADGALITQLLAQMRASQADFTATFRSLADVAEATGTGRTSLGASEPVGLSKHLKDKAAAASWLETWRARLAAEGNDTAEVARAMRAVNPVYIPRNHLVEEAISAAVEADNLAPFETLNEVLSRPFEEQPGRERYALPPLPHEVVEATFCGT